MKVGLKKFLIMGIVISMLSMFTGCNENSGDTTYMESTYFENVMPYQAQNLSDYISVSGTVQSESSINVTSSVGAKITQLNVAVGDFVNVGDILCVMDTTDIQKQISDLEKSIKNATALDENSKELNRKALQNAKDDQQIQLKSAQKLIDDAQENYDKIYKKYSDRINDINKLVYEYNDICQQISDYENSMQQQDIYDDYSEDFYEDENFYDDIYYDDESFENLSNDSIPWDNSMNGYSFHNLSYNADDYSNLLIRKEEISAKIETYKAECEAYEEQFDTLKDAIEDAKENYNSVKRSTDQAIESCQNTVDMQDYQEGDGTASNQLEDLKQQLADCTVKAEKSGTITSLAVAQGDTATQGALLMTIENTSQLKITVNIDEKDILKIKEGMNVVITSEATGEEEISGKVSKVITIISSNGNSSQSLDGSSGSSGFTAEITIDDNSKLLVGMKAKAKIILVEKDNCYSVLYDCIMYDENGNPYVLVADTSNSEGTSATVKRVDITIGEESGSYVEISSDDLKENDLIITTPYDVTEGDTLQISPYVMEFGDNSIIEESEEVVY